LGHYAHRMPNEIPLGTRRTGDLIDFDETTPAVKVTLERTDKGICVVVPWSAPDDYYASWFLGDQFEGLSREGNPVPNQLLFSDSHGEVLLVGCRARGYHTNFATGTGKVWARYAIIGVSDGLNFSELHGLRTEISGLREWIGLRSISQEIDPDTRIFTVTASSGEPINVNDSLTLQPTWRTTNGDGGEYVTVKDLVYCQTAVETASAWEVLKRSHLGIRDLLVISRWFPETCMISAVQRSDDPLRTLDGTQHGQQWRAVVSKGDEAPAPRPSGYRPHLIEYNDLGVDGINRWLSLRDDFSRALDPVVSDRFLDEVGAVTHMAQVGPGLEALGYLLLVRDGMDEKDAARSTLRARLERIITDVTEAIPFSGTDWVDGTVNAYNGIKHANRQLPTQLELANRWRESVLVVRIWTACELGVSPSVVLNRVEHDPQNSPFVPA
jgi:hypothetical protein